MEVPLVAGQPPTGYGCTSSARLFALYEVEGRTTSRLLRTLSDDELVAELDKLPRAMIYALGEVEGMRRERRRSDKKMGQLLEALAHHVEARPGELAELAEMTEKTVRRLLDASERDWQNAGHAGHRWVAVRRHERRMALLARRKETRLGNWFRDGIPNPKHRKKSE